MPLEILKGGRKRRVICSSDAAGAAAWPPLLAAGASPASAEGIHAPTSSANTTNAKRTRCRLTMFICFLLVVLNVDEIYVGSREWGRRCYFLLPTPYLSYRCQPAIHHVTAAGAIGRFIRRQEDRQADYIFGLAQTTQRRGVDQALARGLI